MEIISDIEQHKELITRILSKYGNSAEHNYFCYLYNIEPWEKPYVFIFDVHKEKYCILSKYDNKANTWYLVVEPVAPDDLKAELLIQVIEYAFQKNVKKVWLELETKTKQKLARLIKNRTGFRINKINYTLVWPVFKLQEWNGDKMEGKDWKDMRYYWNKFFRDHKVEFVTADKVSKEALKALVHEWKKKRTTGDKAYIEYFLHAIDNGFHGYDLNRIMIVDGKVAAITAGFVSRPGYYYSTIGLYDKDLDRCNEIANMDDLINLKRLDYELVDFGGQETKSLDFKKKFRPSYFYKTHIFSIIRVVKQ